MKKVVILDTGCCNLTSLLSAVRRLGIEPIVTSEASETAGASRLFLPGVGTAQAAMRALQQRGLSECILQARCPVLGICLGMQLLGSESSETGGVKMLGVIPHKVEKLQVGSLTLPHMGFVHSYAYAVNDCTIATTNYGSSFSAAVRYKNFWGVQFHPERSGATGARLLRNFIEVCDERG